MNQLERHDDFLTTMKVALSSKQSSIWTALPGIIEDFDPVRMTCTVQPAIETQLRDEIGVVRSQPRPLLLDCPVQFPAGGGCTLTFPVAKGDECLVVFASRCVDAWWQSGDVQVQAEPRMHDLSDGFALLGFRSHPRVIGNISTTGAQLRTDDGAAFVEVDAGTHAINATTTGPLNLTAPLVTINGDVQVNGKVTTTGDVKAGTISLQTHLTSGVAPGSGNSGAPVS
jgi:hypothetical protein